MALTDDELRQCQYFLGYTNQTISARPYFEDHTSMFKVAQANLDSNGELRIRNVLLPALTALETRIIAQPDRLQALEVDAGDVKLNPREPDQLDEQRDRLVGYLADVLAIPPAKCIGKGVSGVGGNSSVEVT